MYVLCSAVIDAAFDITAKIRLTISYVNKEPLSFVPGHETGCGNERLAGSGLPAGRHREYVLSVDQLRDHTNPSHLKIGIDLKAIPESSKGLVHGSHDAFHHAPLRPSHGTACINKEADIPIQTLKGGKGPFILASKLLY